MTPTWSLPSSSGRNTLVPPACGTSTMRASKNAAPAGEAATGCGASASSPRPGSGMSISCS
jgi:hypothetical protein